MKYEGKNIYSSGEIADLLGFDDYHRVSNYLSKIGEDSNRQMTLVFTLIP